jgi:hypothetical protein
MFMVARSQDNVVAPKDSWWTTHKQIGMMLELFTALEMPL